MLGKCDKEPAVSDTAYHSDLIREAFPRARYGGVKPAIYAAYRYIAPRVKKQFTERRARSIWEGSARRIDAEEAAVLVVEYRSAHGVVDVQHEFEEIDELHNLIERGPDWNTLIRCTVTLNRVHAPGLTVEKARTL